MANALFNEAKKQILDGALDLTSDTLKMMLVDSAYSFDPDDQFVTASGAGAAELSGTDYAPGFGNSGRRTLTSVSAVRDDANDRGELQVADPMVWAAIDGTNDIAAAVLVKEGTSDADTLLVMFIDTTSPALPQATDGSEFSLLADVEGLLQL